MRIGRVTLLLLGLHPLIVAVQTLAPNVQDQGYFCCISEEWEKVETHPFLYTVCGLVQYIKWQSLMAILHMLLCPSLFTALMSSMSQLRAHCLNKFYVLQTNLMTNICKMYFYWQEGVWGSLISACWECSEGSGGGGASRFMDAANNNMVVALTLTAC